LSRCYGVHEARVEYAQLLREGLQRCEVRILDRDETSLALNYLHVTGALRRGDRVLVNTTAMDLQLGSGGFHVVVWGPRMTGELSNDAGHIMKLRYTPLQMRVLAIEEKASPHHSRVREADDLYRMPVVCLELHSQLLPAVAGIRARDPSLSVAFIMTDGGSLPLIMSEVAGHLTEKDWIRHTLTAGHSFGGQWEAVNVYSALVAARCALRADVAVTCIGPGAVGTGTRFGHSGMQQAQSINATTILNGMPIMPPRFSCTDERRRHRGLSHHSHTVLECAARDDLRVVVAEDGTDLSWREAAHTRPAHGRVISDKGGPGIQLLRTEFEPERARELLRYMGRPLEDERDFFLAASAAGRFAAMMVGMKEENSDD